MKNICILLTFLISFTAFSQRTSEIRPFRVDVRSGIPAILGLNIEYVTPALSDRLAFFANFNGFSTINVDGIDYKPSYFEIGTNIYLFGNGKGLYGSLSYGKLNVDATYFDVIDEDQDIVSEASGEFDASTLNVKAGIKLGGFIYFRAEVGYGFGDIPQEVEITGSINGTQVPIPDQEIPEFPGLSESGYVIANLGVGISF